MNSNKSSETYNFINMLFNKAISDANANQSEIVNVLQSVQFAVNKRYKKFEEVENRLQEVWSFFSEDTVNSKIENDIHCNSMLGLFTKLHNVKYETQTTTSLEIDNNDNITLNIIMQPVFRSAIDNELLQWQDKFCSNNKDQFLIHLSVLQLSSNGELQINLKHLEPIEFNILLEQFDKIDKKSKNNLGAFYHSIKDKVLSKIKETAVFDLQQIFPKSNLINDLIDFVETMLIADSKQQIINRANISDDVIEKFILKWLSAKSLLLKPLIESGFLSIHSLGIYPIINEYSDRGELELNQIAFSFNKKVLTEQQKIDFCNSVKPFLFGQLRDVLSQKLIDEISESFLNCFVQNHWSYLYINSLIRISFQKHSFERIEERLYDLSQSTPNSDNMKELLGLESNCTAYQLNKLLFANIAEMISFSSEEMKLSVNKFLNWFFTLHNPQKSNVKKYCDFQYFFDNDYVDELTLTNLEFNDLDLNTIVTDNWGFLDLLKVSRKLIYKINIHCNDSETTESIYFFNLEYEPFIVNCKNNKYINIEKMVKVLRNSNAIVKHSPIATILNDELAIFASGEIDGNLNYKNYQLIEMDIEVKPSFWENKNAVFGCSLHDMIFKFNAFGDGEHEDEDECNW